MRGVFTRRIHVRENDSATAADATAAENVDATEVTRGFHQRRARPAPCPSPGCRLDTGVDPYPIKFTVTAHVAELEEATLTRGRPDWREVARVAGRVRAIRKPGQDRVCR